MRKAVQIQNDIIKIFPEFNIDLQKANLIKEYIAFLIKWNQKINLTAIREEQQIFVKHILDSIAMANLADTDLSSIPKLGKTLDMGSGAGLPSIILSIIDPELIIFSVDKVKKKVAFQEFVKTQLQLKNFTPIPASLKFLSQDPQHHNSYDTVICRAFDQLPGIFEFSKEFLNSSGKVILWKGQNWKKEWQDCSETIQKEFVLEREVPYHLGTADAGGILLSFQRNQ